MKRLLMVSYDFPPSSRGIWRTLKFCKYMGEFGWRPAILTVRPVRSERYDREPLKELPPRTPIRRTGSMDIHRLAYIYSSFKKTNLPSLAPEGKVEKRPTNALLRGIMDHVRSWVLIPDDRIGWYPMAVQEGLRWLAKTDFDAIYSTSFPNTAHLVGERLARYSGLPYIADFRDIWIGNYYFYHPATKLHDRLQRDMERHVVQRASAVISATGPITDDFLERYPEEPTEKFHTITNGFDPPDFDFSKAQPDREHFTLTYAGTMYGSTSPETLFRSIARLLEKEPEWRDVLRLRFVGTMIEPYQAMIPQYGLESITRIDGYMAHGDALTAMAEADALLLIVAPVEGSHIMLTQKVFEYAAARRPVFGMVPNGAARDFLSDIDEGPVMHSADEEAIEANLRAMLVGWREKGRSELRPNPKLDAYQRRNLTEKLCELLDRAVSTPASS